MRHVVSRSAIVAVSVWSAAAGAALAGQSKDDVIEAAKTMVAQTAVACTVVDAKKAQLEPERGPGRGGGRRGGGMGGGFGGGMGGGFGGGEGRMGGGGPGAFGARGESGSEEGQDSVAQGRGERRSPSVYEVACEEGVGFLFFAAPAARAKPPAEPAADAPAPDYFNCLEAREAAEKNILAVKCELKADHGPTFALQGFADRLGLDCNVRDARGLGHAGDKSFFEIACRAEPAQADQTAREAGYVLITDRSLHGDRPAMAFPCYDAQSNPQLRCELTHVGPVIDALNRFVDKAAPGCAAAEERLAGVSGSGEQVFEVRCRNGDGYLARRAGPRAFEDLVACSDKAAQGACRLAKAEPRS